MGETKYLQIERINGFWREILEKDSEDNDTIIIEDIDFVEISIGE